MAAAAGGGELTTAGMIGVLTTIGYSPGSATGRMSPSHPVFTRDGAIGLPLGGRDLRRTLRTTTVIRGRVLGESHKVGVGRWTEPASGC